MAGFEKVDSLIKQFRFNSTEKRALGALQVVSKSQPVVDKWVKNKYGEKIVVRVSQFNDGKLVLLVGNVVELVEIRKNAEGLRRRLNRVLSSNLIKSITVRVER